MRIRDALRLAFGRFVTADLERAVERFARLNNERCRAKEGGG
jgi:hypothetical protein